MLNGRFLNQSPCLFQLLKYFNNKDMEYQYPKVNVKKLLFFLLKIKHGEICLNVLSCFLKSFHYVDFVTSFFSIEKIYQYMDIYGLYTVVRYFST